MSGLLRVMSEWPKVIKLNKKCPRSTAGECNRLLSEKS